MVQEGMVEVLRQRTAIVIAHRLSTIKRADRIVVMRSGAIIEQGSHDALIEQGGHYAELYGTYFRHQSLEYLETKPVTGAQATARRYARRCREGAGAALHLRARRRSRLERPPIRRGLPPG